ncbi:MAG: hypothetical protein HY587_06995 [Candidatus Omnitrophica bacterium]|nr:hypothetical protein [Candidatus Omnitrophota bacterium]
MPKEAGHKKLGEILLEYGILNEGGLNQALKTQESEGGLLGEILIRLGFVKEEDIVIALATQFNFPYLPIDNFEINPQAVKALPIDTVRQYLCIPIDRVQSILTVVMSDPSNAQAIKTIESTSGCHVQPFVATVTEIKKAIKRYYKLEFPEDNNASVNVSKISFRVAREKKTEKPTQSPPSTE